MIRLHRYEVLTVATVVLILLGATWLVASGMRRTAPFQDEEYWLEQLVNRQLKQAAPPSIGDAILAAMRTELDADRRDGAWDGSKEHLIAVIPIDLNRDGVTDYLAIPDHFIPAFHGNRSSNPCGISLTA